MDPRSHHQNKGGQGQIQVFVKTLEGKTLTVDTYASEMVEVFRAKVDHATGVAASQQRLATQMGQTLEDGKRLSEYDIVQGSTIHCHGRLRGGDELN